MEGFGVLAGWLVVVLAVAAVPWLTNMGWEPAEA